MGAVASCSRGYAPLSSVGDLKPKRFGASVHAVSTESAVSEPLSMSSAALEKVEANLNLSGHTIRSVFDDLDKHLNSRQSLCLNRGQGLRGESLFLSTSLGEYKLTLQRPTSENPETGFLSIRIMQLSKDNRTTLKSFHLDRESPDSGIKIRWDFGQFDGSSDVVSSILDKLLVLMSARR
jgi:hypothetical protein